jgi:hypothetical protein
LCLRLAVVNHVVALTLTLEELKLVPTLSVRLREVKEAEKRIYAREETIQKLMLNLADLAVMDSLNFGRLSGTEYGQLMRQWRDQRIDTILSLVEATPEQKAHLRRYVPIYKALDDAYALDLPHAERTAAAAPYNQQLLDQFRSEISGDSP